MFVLYQLNYYFKPQTKEWNEYASAFWKAQGANKSNLNNLKLNQMKTNLSVGTQRMGHLHTPVHTDMPQQNNERLLRIELLGRGLLR